MVWATEDTSFTWYSKNGGISWSASTGIGGQTQVVADRAKGGVFYAYLKGVLFSSIDGGATFAQLQTGLPSAGYGYAPTLVSLPDHQGDLWLTGGDEYGNLYINSGSATAPHLTTLAGVQTALRLGYGKTAPGSSDLTLFLAGTLNSTTGLYRSTDGGATWVQINDSLHQWGGISVLAGDMRTFGTIYLGTSQARGIIWGTSPN